MGLQTKDQSSVNNEAKASVVVAQLGARMHYAVPEIFHNRRMLDHFYTDIYSSSSGIAWMQTVPRRWRPEVASRLLGRKPTGIPDAKISSFPWFGLRYGLRLQTAASKPDRVEAHLWAGKQFNLHLIDAIGDRWDEINAVYTFNTAGLELLQAASSRNTVGVVEQTIAPSAYERELLRHEADRYPEWEYVETESDARLTKYAEREQAEWEAADAILCGSTFVRDGIEACGGPAEKCVIVPYGVSPDTSDASPRVSTHTPVRVLFVGALGLRKGAPYMLKLARLFGEKATVRMVGSVQISDSAKRKLASVADLAGRVPRSVVQDHYRWADVFVLPSICEGSATVCYEALSHGLPVICTPNTGAIVRDGIDGYIVPTRSPQAIASRIDLLTNDDKLYENLSASAFERARTFGSMEAYAERLTSTVKNLCNRKL